MSLTFDEATHTYRHNGDVVPSVTQLLEPMYDFRFVKYEHLEAARVLGSAVDKTIRLSEAGRLDEERTPPRLLKHLDSWRRFKKDTGFQAITLGTRLFCEEYRYAGTPDVYGRIGQDQHEILIDIKTGSFYAAHELQTAGYFEMMVRLGLLGRSCTRASLYLDETTYNIKFHTDINDRAVFLGLVTQFYWRLKHGK